MIEIEIEIRMENICKNKLDINCILLNSFVH